MKILITGAAGNLGSFLARETQLLPLLACSTLRQGVEFV